jgi:septin family protein
MKPPELYSLKRAILEELTRASIPFYRFGLSISELMELTQRETPNLVPFVVCNRKAAPSISVEGTMNEFEILRRAMLFTHVDDLRHLSAEK